MEKGFDGLYQCTFEYQINNFWKIFKESINYVIDNNDKDISKENIIMLFNFVNSNNKIIRKLSFLSLCLLLYFKKARNIFYNTYGILERNGWIILSDSFKNEKSKNFIKKIFKEKDIIKNIYEKDKSLNIKYDFIWYYEDNNFKILKLSLIKEVLVNENLNLIFDSNKFISGIIGVFNDENKLVDIKNYFSQKNDDNFSFKKKSKSNEKANGKNINTPKMNLMFLKNKNKNKRKKTKNKTSINNYYEKSFKNNKISNKFVNNNLNIKLDKIVNFNNPKTSIFKQIFPKLFSKSKIKSKKNSINKKRLISKNFKKFNKKNKKDTSLNKSKISNKINHKKNKSLLNKYYKDF